ncbi:MAG: hypothetical protein ACR2KJ_04235 [Jatrophihabitans sp.]
MKRAIWTVAVGIVAVVGTGSAVAYAGPLPSATVSENPVDWTPNVVSANATVEQLVQCGSTMYAVGTFTSVARPGGAKVTRNNAFSFSATTGAITSWDPNANGAVHSIALSSDCSAAYLVGSFTSVKGTTAKYVAKVNASTAAVDTTFRPAPNNQGETVILAHGQLFVGGYFTAIGGGTRPYLASLSPTTGAATNYSTITVSGRVPGNSTAVSVHKLRLDPTGSRVLAMGAFTAANGATRMQAFVIDLGASATTLDGWYAPGLTPGCAADKVPFFVRAGNWSPDGSRIYLATTGYKGPSPYCDKLVQFSSSSSSTQSALWINDTGCDSLYAVAADATSVYMGGHERFADNERGCDYGGAGSVPRPGIGSVQTSSGRANAWNPTRDRGHGADDMLRSGAGLWVASDTFFYSVKCGGEYHPGICFFPNA